MLNILKQNLKENDFEFYRPLDGSPFWRQVLGSKTMFYTDDAFEQYCLQVLSDHGHALNRIEPTDLHQFQTVFASVQVSL